MTVTRFPIHIFRPAVVLLLCVMIWPSFASPQRREKNEYEIKALLVEAVCRYVTWPSHVWRTGTHGKFVIGIIGDGSINRWLKRVYTRGKIKGRRIRMVTYSDPENITGCHVLVIAPSAGKYLPHILAAVREKPILTISDSDGFCKKGVHVNLYKEKEVVRFEVNPYAMRSVSLQAHSRLLKLAKIVKTWNLPR